LLFGDAPPHDRDQELLGALLSEFDGVVHAVDVSGFAFAGGVPGTEQAFRAIAERGRGAFVRLGEGDGDDLLRQVLVLVLGPRHRAAIETLFGL